MTQHTVVACLALLVLSCAPPKVSDPQWSPESADLLFMSNREGNAEVYLLPAGGGEWVNLTRDPAVDDWPEWSPDGSKIAFHSNRGGDRLDVWVMNADGTDPVRLTDHPDHDYLPSWSPDGTRIAFASWRTEAEGEERAPHICVMNADGTDQRRLMADSPGTSSGVGWSPDGARIIFSKKSPSGVTDLFIANAEGSGVVQLTDDAAYDGAGVFSPDGRSIAFYSEDEGGSRIVVIDADGSRRRVVVESGNNWYPRWSPDGVWLVFTAAVSGGAENDLDLFAVPVDGSKPPVKLVGGPEREAEGRWRPSVRRVRS